MTSMHAQGPARRERQSRERQTSSEQHTSSEQQTSREQQPGREQQTSTALRSVLAGGVLGWVFFMLAVLSDMLTDAGRSPDELFGHDATAIVRPSTYLFFAAIAVFTLGGLIGRRLVQDPHPPAGTLARAVQVFASTVIIIGLVLAAGGAIIVFLTNFQSATEQAGAVVRILNSYLPIVLYTALVIVVILTGFVFTRRASAESADDPASAPYDPASAPHDAPAAYGTAGPHDAAAAYKTADPHDAAAPRDASGTADRGASASHPDGRRPLALAFTVPIIAVAVALIFGLIVYDLTRTALEVWIWVIVQACIAIGIVVGTFFAARAISAQRRAAPFPHGAPVGAVNLNLILSIVFAGAVTVMSLGYGASAMHHLHVQPSIWLSSYSDAPSEGAANPAEVIVSASGSDLARGTEISVRLEPGDGLVASAEVDRYGGAWLDEPLPSDIAPGDYELSLEAEAADGAVRSVAIPVTVTEDGLVELPGDPNAGNDAEPSRVIPPTAAWLFGDLVPAAVLLALVVGTLSFTLRMRTRDARQ